LIGAGGTRKTRVTKKHSCGAGTRKARVPRKHCFGVGTTTASSSSSQVEGIGTPSLEPQHQPVNISNSQEIPPPVYTKEEFDRLTYLAYLASIFPYSRKAELDCQPHSNCLCCQHVFGDFRYYTKEEEDIFPLDD